MQKCIECFVSETLYLRCEAYGIQSKELFLTEVVFLEEEMAYFIYIATDHSPITNQGFQTLLPDFFGPR